MEQALKDTFTNYRILNCTDKNDDAIDTIVKLCHSNKNLIVYIRRHEDNQRYFRFLEIMEQRNQFYDPNPIIELVLNLDNYVGFRESDAQIEHKIRDVRKSLIDDEECTVCMEKKSETISLYICPHCSNSTCMNCLGGYIKTQVLDGNATHNSSNNKVYFKCASCRKTNDITL